MLRVAFIDILLFLLPFVIYAVYALVVRGQSAGTFVDTMPVLWLLAAGFALLFIVMVTLVSFTGGDTTATYHPSLLKNGVIEPGRIE